MFKIHPGLGFWMWCYSHSLSAGASLLWSFLSGLNLFLTCVPAMAFFVFYYYCIQFYILLLFCFPAGLLTWLLFLWLLPLSFPAVCEKLAAIGYCDVYDSLTVFSWGGRFFPVWVIVPFSMRPPCHSWQWMACISFNYIFLIFFIFAFEILFYMFFYVSGEQFHFGF